MNSRINEAELKKGTNKDEFHYIKGYRFYTRKDKVILLINNIMLALFGIVVLYPLVYIASMSISSISAVQAGRVWLWPVDISFLGYEAVFRNENIISGYANSFLYMVCGTVVNVFMTIICAYPLSRRNFKARNFFMVLLTITMFFSGGLIPTYLLISKLGLINSRLALIIPGAMSAWNVIIARTYIKANISDELREAAQLDGCNDFRYLFRIVFPLSKAIIAVIALYASVGIWNSYFDALIYIRDRDKMPLQIILREILILNQMGSNMMTVTIDATEMTKKLALRELLKYSLIIVASVPMLCLYPWVQKYFVKGVMLGSLKG